jgi:hypothetical protein
MHACRSIRFLIVAMMVGSTLVPQAVFAESSPETVDSVEQPLLSDIALQANGTLRGKVEDANGKPKANVELTVWHEKQPVGKIRSNQKGEFAFTGLRGGVHRVTTQQSAYTCRFWSPNTAPPSASLGILLIDNPLATAEDIESIKQAQYVEPGDGYVNSAPPMQQRRPYRRPTKKFCKRPGGIGWHNPLVIGGLVATAIAIPVALNGNGDDASGS